MSHITKEEYLSAYLDGEAGSFEEHRLSDQLDGDDLLRDKLRDYALIGEAMRHESQPLPVGNTFLSGIQDAIKDDIIDQPSDTTFPQHDLDQSSPVISPNTAPANDTWRLSPQIVGYAAVASVAAVAALSLQNMLDNNGAMQVNTLASAPAAVVSEPVVETQKPVVQTTVAAVAASSDKYSIPDAKTRSMMAQLAQHHLQYASSSTLMPWVRTVSYSTDY